MPWLRIPSKSFQFPEKCYNAIRLSRNFLRFLTFKFRYLSLNKNFCQNKHQSLSDGWKSSNMLRLIQRQALKQLCMFWLRLRLLIDRCQHLMADHYVRDLQDFHLRHKRFKPPMCCAFSSSFMPKPWFMSQAVSAALRPNLN